VKKNPTQKRAGRVVQVVECLTSKCETLNSNSVPPKNQTKTKKLWPRCRETGIIIHCWYECKMVQLLWKTNCSLLLNKCRLTIWFRKIYSQVSTKKKWKHVPEEPEYKCLWKLYLQPKWTTQMTINWWTHKQNTTEYYLTIKRKY
jgi:hypothetical protein